MTPPLDQRQVRRAFGRAAPTYAQHAVLQREVESRLLERLDYVGSVPARAIDLGCGPGRAVAQMRRRYKAAQIIALDMSLPMLRQAKPHRRWLRAPFANPIVCLCADARALPLADASVDVLFSNLCVQWIEDLPALFDEWRRVLRPGGFLAFSTFGPQTLDELRCAWAAADQAPHVNRFADMLRVGDALMGAGFRDPVLDRERLTLTYADATTLMRELRAMGATNADALRTRTLTGKGHLQRVIAGYEPMRRDGRLPATYEVIYAHAFAPEHGQPRRTAGGEIASFPVERLRGSRRQS